MVYLIFTEQHMTHHTLHLQYQTATDDPCQVICFTESFLVFLYRKLISLDILQYTPCEELQLVASESQSLRLNRHIYLPQTCLKQLFLEWAAGCLEWAAAHPSPPQLAPLFGCRFIFECSGSIKNFCGRGL